MIGPKVYLESDIHNKWNEWSRDGPVGLAYDRL